MRKNVLNYKNNVMDSRNDLRLKMFVATNVVLTEESVKEIV